MARDIISHLTSPAPSGADLAENYAGHINTFYDAMAAPLISVSGSNSIAATANVDFIGNGLLTGQRVVWQQAATTTSSTVTLALNGGTAQPVLDSEGNALPIGALASGQWVMAVWSGSDWRVITPLATSTASGQPRYHWRYTSNATWTRPAGLSDDTMVTVILIGAGGGGGGGNGGGGGGASIGHFRLGDLASSVSVTVPAGGAGGTASTAGQGGNTTFGSHLTAYGGGPGRAAGGGGGGGAAGAGASGVPGAMAGTIYSGGNGSSDASDGGIAYYGGGGGASTTASSDPGTSVRSGNGGANGAPGQAPGGGGGAGTSGGFDGGRGQADIYL